MIVDRAQQQEIQTASYLQEIHAVLRRLDRGDFRRHEDAVELLIDYGEFEAAVADLLSTDANQVHPPVLGLIRGFLVMEFVTGRPMNAANVDRAFLDHVVRYLAYLSRMPATGVPMPHEEFVKDDRSQCHGGIGGGLGQEIPAVLGDR